MKNGILEGFWFVNLVVHFGILVLLDAFFSFGSFLKVGILFKKFWGVFSLW